MKPVMIATMLCLLLMGCGGEQETSRVDDADQLCEAAAKTALGDMSRELKSELMAAVNDGGFAEAISVCSERAHEIAAAHSEPGLFLVKRVSDRFRNPDNTLTPELQGAFAGYGQAETSMGPHGEWSDTEAGRLYRYYQPIVAGKLCLNCHGATDQLADGVAERLAELYPEDRATGYREGDLRGMAVVEINWPAARALLTEMTAADKANP